MRPQEDNLRDFAVYMTERGIVAITDPPQIAVYDLLCDGGKRPSDIADALGLPSSSLHFTLDKMVEAGIIVRYKPDPVRKEVYYSTLALKIAGNARVSPQVIEYSEETFRGPDAHYTGLSTVANMLEGYLAEVGLDHTQLRARYARDLADAVAPQIGEGPIEDVMQKIKDRFCAITGYKMSVYALNPPSIVFEGDATIRPKMDMLSRFVRFMIETSTGRSLKVRSTEDFSTDDAVRIKVVYDRSESEPSTYINTSLHQDLDVEDFMIVEVDGSVQLVMSDIQIPIIEVIYERPLCVTDIVNSVSIPRSTVTTNLLRLVEDGIATVFYSESGAIYYGLSCSILMKRNRRISKDQTAIRDAVRQATGDDAFMEGYLLYTLASFQALGFDTDYLMVVLGAKYMRTAGQDGPKNFDAYFGKMSDIARIVGLSLKVASVYPLTIGITRSGDEESLAPAMTFVKGMAHQGLEMASSGMFVRVSEETPEDMKVSFKEIYPSLSMNPSAGADTEKEVEAAPAKKKRTSSVRDALRKRSVRTEGRPVRTMRYITAIAVLCVAALLVMGAGPSENTASSDSYSIDVLSDSFYLVDQDGNTIDMPYTVRAETVVSFSVVGDVEGVGMVIDGVAYPLSGLYNCVDGLYTVPVNADIDVREIRSIDVPEGFTAAIYNFDGDMEPNDALSYGGYHGSEDYVSKAGDLWVSEDAWVVFTAADGEYVISEDGLYIGSVCLPAFDDLDLVSATIPSDAVTVTLNGFFIAGGYLVSGDIMVAPGNPVTMKFVSTDGPVKLVLEQSGRFTDLVLNMDRMVTINVDQDVSVSYEHVGIE